ncbi:YhhN-like family protein [Stigmatella aurantiaca DW4/3-1]|nr:YhhN-like family protein [Stigmatella aurantiaca DW4/3-1]
MLAGVGATAAVGYLLALDLERAEIRLVTKALPVTAYIAVICTMTWRAAAMVGSAGLTRREQWTALAGALMFTASDGLLALKLFVRPLPGAGYAIMLLYWSAQLCIAVSARERPAPSPAPASEGALSSDERLS